MKGIWAVGCQLPTTDGSELCVEEVELSVTTMINVNRFALLSGRHWKQLLTSAHARNAEKQVFSRFQRRSFKTHPRHLAYAKELFLGQVNKVTQRFTNNAVGIWRAMPKCCIWRATGWGQKVLSLPSASLNCSSSRCGCAERWEHLEEFRVDRQPVCTETERQGEKGN